MDNVQRLSFCEGVKPNKCDLFIWKKNLRSILALTCAQKGDIIFILNFMEFYDMATENKFLKSLTLDDVNSISHEFLMGFVDLGKRYPIRLKGLNNKRLEFGLDPITRYDSIRYRINYLNEHYTSEEIECELFDFLKRVRISNSRWSGFDLLGCHFNARDYVYIFKQVLGSTTYRKISESTRLLKIEETDSLLYGGIGAGSDVIRSSIVGTVRERYGVNNVMQNLDIVKRVKTPFSDPKVRQKAMMTKSYNVRKSIVLAKKTRDVNNASFKSSYELVVFKILVEKYGFDDVYYEYGLHPYDNRYPFNCDFYVKSLDLFIELNIHPSHGGKWYLGTHEDKLRLEHLKLSTKKSAKEKILAWSERDVEKRLMAKKHNLKYLVFWDNDLFDFMMWHDNYNCNYEAFIRDFKENTYF